MIGLWADCGVSKLDSYFATEESDAKGLFASENKCYQMLHFAVKYNKS